MVAVLSRKAALNGFWSMIGLMSFIVTFLGDSSIHPDRRVGVGVEHGETV